MKKDRSKGPRWGLGLYVAAAVVLLTIILSSVWVITQKMESSAASTAQYLLGSLTENLSTGIQADEDAIGALANTIEATADPATIRRQLAALKESYGMLDVYWMDAQGTWAVSTNPDPVPAEAETRNFDPKTLIGFSDTFHGSYGVWETDYRIPVIRAGKLAGAVYVCIPMNKYGKDNGMLYYGEQGIAYLFDVNTRKIVMLPSAPDIVASYMQNVDMLFENMGFSPEDVEQRIYPSVLRGETLVIRGTLDGHRVYVTLMKLSIHSGWYVCGVVPAAEIQKEAGTVLWLLTAVLLCMGLLCIGILWLVIRWTRRRARQRLDQLRQAEMQKLIYDTVGNASDIVLCVFDRHSEKYQVVFHNIARILGIDPNQLMEDPACLTPLLDLADPELYPGMLENQLPEEAVYRFAYNHPVRHELREIRLTLKGLDIQGRDFLMLMAEDITGDMKIQDSLHAALENANQANRAKSEFLSRMSHDIRTPINAIIGMREIAKRHLNDPGRIEDCLDKIQVSSNHLLGLINDILDLSKIESGKLSLHNEPFRLSQCLDGVFSIIQTQAAAKQQSAALYGQVVRYNDLIGDEMRLKQILLNLLSNAVKYTQVGGELSLTVEEQPQEGPNGGCVERFTVRDNGVGMSPEFLEKIGRPFEQEANVFHKSELGSGLGLSIVKNLVSLMGGMFFVESQLGVGTVVRVEIPFQQNQPADKQPSPDQPAVPGPVEDLEGKRVLVVEDNALNREIAEELLSARGMQVEDAEDGQEAVEKFQASPEGYYDLILMDLQMPRMDGCTAAQTIRGENRTDAASVVIIAMTANAFSEDVLRCRQAGMDDHLSKPIQLDRMYTCIAQNLYEKNREKREKKT